MEEFALLILDIRMPGMTGFELAQMIKERKKTARVPIIFLTAYYNDDQHVIEGYGTGAVDYLHKPVNAHILRSKVAVFAELHRVQRESATANRTLLAEVTERRRAEEKLSELNDVLRQSEQQQRELLEQSRAMEGQLRSLSRQVLQAQEDERKRISRELHDVIAQALTGINVRLALLQSAAGTSNGDLREKITQTQLMVEQSVDTVHRFARDLRPAMLDNLGLMPALHTYLNDYTHLTGIRVEVTADEGIETLESAGRTVLFRIVQEALTNVARHAKASHAKVIIQHLNDRICMEIKDDGQGFEVNGASGSRKSSRLGLLGMKERVEMTGGSFSIESAPGTPTTVRVEIPANI